jgi:hypothetical protein
MEEAVIQEGIWGQPCPHKLSISWCKILYFEKTPDLFCV